MDTRKAIALLAYVAAEGPQRRATLAGLLWPDSDTARARAALRRTLSVLRNAAGEECILVDQDIIALDATETSVDLWDVESAIDRRHGHAHAPGCEECIAWLLAAADAHRGPFLDGFRLRDAAEFDDWVELRREHQRRRHAAVLEDLVRHLTRRRRFDEAADRTRQRLSLDPLHERSHQHLMLLHAWSGRRSEAVEQYRRCVAALDRELGVAPLSSTTALYEQILSGKVPPPPPTDGSVESAPLTTSSPHEPAVISRPATPHLPFVGRSRHLSHLLARYDRVSDHGQAVVLMGEAGIGKTRLADELRRAVEETGGTTLATRCHEGEANLPFGAVAELVRSAHLRGGAAAAAPHTLLEVSRLLPEVLDGEVAPDLPALDTPGARARFLEALSVYLELALGGGGSGALVLDDLHWADSSTLEAVAYLLRRLDRRRLLVLLCCRPEDTPPTGPLERVVATVAAAAWGGVIDLERLDEDDVRRVLQRVAPDRSDLAGALHRETEGVPFLLVEYLQSLPGPDEPWTLPESARKHLSNRLAGLPDLDRQLISAAAVIGRTFDAALLVATSGRSPDEVAAVVDGLVQRRFLREVDGSLGFAHDKVRLAVYQALGATRRRLLHARVADALAAGARSDHELDARAAITGSHLERAGNGEEAADHYRRAARHARTLAAHDDALAHLRAARSLGHRDVAGVHEEIGDVLVQLGTYADATASYEAAAAYVSDDDALARLEQKLAGVHLRRGDRSAADAHLRTALDLLGQPAHAGNRARVLADRALVALRSHEVGEAAALASQALHLAEAADDMGALAVAHNLVGMVARRRNDPETARAALTESLRLASQLDDEPMQVAALNNLALLLRGLGELDAARATLEDAIARCRNYGDRHREAALLNNLADIEYDRGERDAAMLQLKAAVALFADVGEPDRHEPGIWTLVDW